MKKGDEIIMENEVLKIEKKNAKEVARQLGYGDIVINKIEQAINIIQIDNIMISARKVL